MYHIYILHYYYVKLHIIVSLSEDYFLATWLQYIFIRFPKVPENTVARRISPIRV
jgi:hypothetical protein